MDCPYNCDSAGCAEMMEKGLCQQECLYEDDESSMEKKLKQAGYTQDQLDSF